MWCRRWDSLARYLTSGGKSTSPYRHTEGFAEHVDDYVIYSWFVEEHLDHLKQIFALWSRNKMILALKKSYLGYLSV